MIFPPPGLPAPNELLLVTDQLASPADFLLHKFLSTHLKQLGARCLMLSLSESLTKWKVLAAKANVNLAHHISSGTVVFMDNRSLPDASATSQDVAAALRPWYDSIRSTLQLWVEDSSPTLVILDDVSILEWTGFSVRDVSHFLRALAVICRQTSSSLILRQHVTTPEDLDDVTRSLLQICTHHLEVLPLNSGRSGAVSGEIALHPGPGVCNPNYRPILRSAAIQYRLTDSSCVFFERGTENHVL